MARKKRSTGALLLAGLAAFAYYRFSKMSPDEKRRLFDGIREQGKKLVDEYVPTDLQQKLTKNGFAKNGHSFGAGTYYNN